MSYSASEVAKKLELSKDCLRYYEKEGLIPIIERNSSGHRVYSDSDIEWIFLIKCLRDTDMQIFKIKKYVALLINNGSESVQERREILLEHEAFIKKKMATYISLQQLIEKKLNFYNEALDSNSSNSAHCMDYATEWEHFRTILGGIKHD